MSIQHKIVSVGFHRNGSGQESPFYAALVDTKGTGLDSGISGRYLCIDMTGVTLAEAGYATQADADADNWDENEHYFPENFAVLRVDHIAANNIGSNPIFDALTGKVQPGTGDAAQRGNLWSDLRGPIRDWYNASCDARDQHYRDQRAARTT